MGNFQIDASTINVPQIMTELYDNGSWLNFWGVLNENGSVTVTNWDGTDLTIHLPDLPTPTFSQKSDAPNS